MYDLGGTFIVEKLSARSERAGMGAAEEKREIEISEERQSTSCVSFMLLRSKSCCC